jgi:NADPH:quinone reductase-like Zn-dependent oxidoreductase
LERIVEWMKEGKVRSVVDTRFGFEEARGALERLKTGRCRGKVVVDVAGESWKSW